MDEVNVQWVFGPHVEHQLSVLGDADVEGPGEQRTHRVPHGAVDLLVQVGESREVVSTHDAERVWAVSGQAMHHLVRRVGEEHRSRNGASQLRVDQRVVAMVAEVLEQQTVVVLSPGEYDAREGVDNAVVRRPLRGKPQHAVRKGTEVVVVDRGIEIAKEPLQASAESAAVIPARKSSRNIA